MQNLRDLQELEKKTFQTFFEDGLLDIYFGVMLIPFILWIITGLPIFAFLPVFLFLIFWPFLQRFKERLIQPRIGRIKPDPARKNKFALLVLGLLMAIIVTIGLVLFTAFGGPGSVIFLVFAVSVFLTTTLVAWMLDLPRILIYGTLTAITIPLDTVYLLRSGFPPTTIIPMVIMVSTGILLLFRFLKRYPIQPEEERYNRES
jgi:hypothetical protein